MITAAAIRRASDGQVFSLPKPARHSDVMRECGRIEVDGRKVCSLRGDDNVQGFVDEAGTFYNRKQARAHAWRCGQHTGELIGSVLTSEDLW